MRAAQHFGKLAKKIIQKQIHSVLFRDARMGFKERSKKIESNVGVSYALYDEGAWQNELNTDLENAPEILRLINCGAKKK